jgi:CheY-like chemotaxis protein
MPKAGKILLVEDDSFDAEMTIHILQKLELEEEIIWLKTGQYLLDYLEEHGSKEVVLVLLDLNMPQVSGLEALRVIKARGYDFFPIVMLTSSRRPSEIEACYALGCNSFVTKPVHQKQFQEVVTQLGTYWTQLNELST